ncbi:MAG: L,D-transpeptidase [Deltaproteobacteria bacterium]|nr:L,D-transpeptidase [Deltaproteobacteria bacterium]
MRESIAMCVVTVVMSLFLTGIAGAAEENRRQAGGRETLVGHIARRADQPAQRLESRGGEKTAWKRRVVTPSELEQISEKDPDLYPVAALEILARINTRARYHIAEDVQKGRPILVPDDFTHYKDWSPVPEVLPSAFRIPKLILIVKDIPFIGWYEHGKLVGDSLICIGKRDSWTRAGTYRVLNKDKDHVSRSYTNAYGQPAPMPWALRIYGHVWIHAGDIEKGYCSHGCINLPWFPAIELFQWADTGTVVHIMESTGQGSDGIPGMASNRRLSGSP